MKEFLGAGEGAEKINSTSGSFSVRGALDIDTSSSSMETNGVAEESSSSQQAEFIERVKYIPLRLTWSERKSLRLCEAALNVSYRFFWCWALLDSRHGGEGGIIFGKYVLINILTLGQRVH